MKVYYEGSFWKGRVAASDRDLGMDVLGTYVRARSLFDVVPVVLRLLWCGCVVERVERSY